MKQYATDDHNAAVDVDVDTRLFKQELLKATEYAQQLCYITLRSWSVYNKMMLDKVLVERVNKKICSTPCQWWPEQQSTSLEDMVRKAELLTDHLGDKPHPDTRSDSERTEIY